MDANQSGDLELQASQLTCKDFTTSSSTSSRINVPRPLHDGGGGGGGGGGDAKDISHSQDSGPCSKLMSTTTSSSSTLSIDFFNKECELAKNVKEPPNISYEVAIAKSILKQISSISGDNLFDHLSDIIKRVIDERPPNLIDFFEEFSRSIREQKLRLPERFPPDAIYEESRVYRMAKKLLESMKLPYPNDEVPPFEEISMDEIKTPNSDDLRLKIIDDRFHMFITFNERVQQLQFLWNQCGFSISSDDIFQLALAMNRLQIHPSIAQCRFWGVINGLKASYYIVEAQLTSDEIQARYDLMQQEMQERNPPKVIDLNKSDEPPVMPPHVGPELTPGARGWENWPVEEIQTMQPPADPIPLVKTVEPFDVPPENIGRGTNRYSYFVVNSLSDDWIELPVVTPKQIVISREIRKFLTGDLEAEIISSPCFPGKEKHYLRALIARITAGTYIAPEGYYRKMTKKEERLFEGIEPDEMDEEDEGEEEEDMMGEDEEEDINNDIVLLKNEKYVLPPLETLGPPANWVHVRPNILQEQGRVVWFDVQKALNDREKEIARLMKLAMMEGLEEEEEEEAEDEDEGEEEGMLEYIPQPEIGPPILNHCHLDLSNEFNIPWTARYTSAYSNQNERVLVMRSNTWPGAFTFIFEKTCESVYMGWGLKYLSRNMPFIHQRAVAEEYPHTMLDFIEADDPTVEEEEAYRLALLRRQMRPDEPAEHLSDYDENDTHESNDDDDDDDDDDGEEEEEEEE